MYENILKDAQEVKRRLLTIGEKVDETVICELLESFGPHYGVDHIISMITENWDSDFQNASDKAGPSIAAIQHAIEKPETRQRSCAEYVEISDISTDSDEDKDDYYTAANWDDISIIDTVTRLSSSPVELCGNTLLNDNQTIAVHPEVEFLEENNNDPNNNLDSIQMLQELQNNPSDTNHEARTPSTEEFVMEFATDSENPKPGCSKDSHGTFTLFKNQCKLYKEAEQIHALLPKFKYNVIYKTLCKNQYAKNRIELTMWDLLPEERPDVQVSSKRKLLDDTCSLECKKSVSEISNPVVFTKKCLTHEREAYLKKGKVCTKNEIDTVHIKSGNIEFTSLIDKADKVKRNVQDKKTVLHHIHNNSAEQSIVPITEAKVIKSNKQNTNIDIYNIYDLKKFKSPQIDSKNEEMYLTNKIRADDSHFATTQNTILRPAKLTFMNSNTSITSTLQSTMPLSNPILAPAKLKYITVSQKSTKSAKISIHNTSKRDISKQDIDEHTTSDILVNRKNKKASGMKIAQSHSSVSFVEDNTTILQNKTLPNIETERTRLSDGSTLDSLQSNCTKNTPILNTSREVKSESEARNNLLYEGDDITSQRAMPLVNRKTGATNTAEQLKMSNSSQLSYGKRYRELGNQATALGEVKPMTTFNSSEYERATIFVDPRNKQQGSYAAAVRNTSCNMPSDLCDENTIHTVANENMQGKQKDANNDKEILNQKALNAYYMLIPMFPSLNTDYIKQICQTYTRDDAASLDETELLEDLVEHLLNHGQKQSYSEKVKPISMPNRHDINEQYANLLGIFPEADPMYLRDKAEQIYNDPDKIKQFVQSKLETPDYPTREQYLAKKKITEQQKHYTTDFQVQRFLEIFPNPFSHFEDAKRQCRFNADAVDFLKHHFNKFKISTLLNVYAQYAHNLSLTAKALETLNSDMKSKRFYPLIRIEDIPLLQEIAFIQHKTKLKQYLAELKEKEEKEFKELKARNELLECQCCYENECMPSKCSTCADGHIFCNSCIAKSVDIKLANGDMHINCLLSCDSEFKLSVLQRILPPTKFSILLQKRQEAEVIAAGLEGLVSCPFCHFASIPPPEDKVFKCFNPDCMKESCRSCKEINHVPLKCGEVRSDTARLYLEEKMTEALVRKCYRCGRTFFKEEGCNKMTCLCGAQMCYLCDEPITNYDHFNQGTSRSDRRCLLWTDDRRMNAEAVIKVCQETVKHMKEKDPAVELNTDALLPKLPIQNKWSFENIHANMLPARANRIVRQFP